MENKEIKDTRPIMLPLVDDVAASSFREGVEAEISRNKRLPKPGNPVSYTLPRWVRKREERNRKETAAKNIRIAYDAGLIDSQGRSLVAEPLGTRDIPGTIEDWDSATTIPDISNEDTPDAAD